MQIVKVQFKHSHTGEFKGTEYSYFAEDDNLAINDEVEVDTKFGKSIAKVTQVNVPAEEVVTFIDYMKTIPKAPVMPILNNEDVPF
ncbi:MAG: hypothetical protein FD141_385 [Fusobacteria bacterium]|nr:MAG: hypothetical protein FD141_385 [Fusobacteriota bacterium]KAF0228950.1 MAG: hypothetical protein FD182_1206 [Fusobacteriota bacterium]